MAEPLMARRRYYGGIFALLCVVVIWVTSSFTMNSIFGDLQYNKPFLVTYLNTATFSFYLIPFLFKQPRKNAKMINSIESPRRYQQSSELESRSHLSTTATTKLGTLDTIKLSFAFCILWFFANYTTNASLAYTSVGSSTILASMSGLFTLGIGSMFNVEKITAVKLISVCMSFMGVVLVSYSDQKTYPADQEPNTIGSSSPSSSISTALVGDILALLGAVFYGCYTTMLKLRIGNEDRIDMPLFFGFVGAFNVLLLWPVFPLLDWLGIESFQLPYTPTLWIMVLLNAFIGTFLSDYLWLLAMLMTSPLVVTLGISLTIPLALFGDIVFKHFVPQPQYAIGALLVVIGFVTVNLAAIQERNQDDNLDGDQQREQQQSLIPNQSTPVNYQSIP